jgi:hypothetical protein
LREAISWQPPECESEAHPPKTVSAGFRRAHKAQMY